MRPLLVALATTLLSCGGPEEREDISYDDRFEATKLDLFLPDGSGPRPAVMLVHGGAWAYGGRWMMNPSARRLAGAGYVAASIAYRLVPDARFPSSVQDAWCALSFLRAHASEYRIDPNRIAVLGYSAGGHTVSMLGVAPNDPSLDPDCAAGRTAPPRAVIAGAPVVDMREFADSSAIVDFMGGEIGERPAAYDLASPIRFVRRDLPPFLFIVGGGDWWVGDEDSRKMRDLLRAEGNDARILEVGGGGHALSPVGNGSYVWTQVTETPEAWLAIEDFLARTIGKP
jgi:acetyl esterase/lipase